MLKKPESLGIKRFTILTTGQKSWHDYCNLIHIKNFYYEVKSLATFGMITPTVAVIVLIIALIIFGPGKLPQIGKGLGRGIKEFKTEANIVTEENDIAGEVTNKS